jgi:hypothetical protein
VFFWARVALVLTAAAAALVPMPAGLVERVFAGWWYPAVQARLTAWSNLSSLSLFDVLIVVVSARLVTAWLRAIGAAFRRRSPWPLGRAVATAITWVAAGYLWFLLAWGMNYARRPIESVVPFDPSRIDVAALRALAWRSSDEVNATHEAAHATGFPEVADVPGDLVRGLHRVEQRLGRPRPTTPTRPKRTGLGLFFRWSGVDGMHAPFLLETLLNPDLTPAERPAVLAHEWAHLSGYAPEDDASFVGLLAAMEADAGARYSAWLAVFDHTVSQLPAVEQRALVARLAPGPRADRAAIASRLRARVDVVARASWQTYDQYLKAQGVREGVRSYSRVVQLLLGSGALDTVPSSRER